MAAGRSTARAAWAAIVGVVIGAALLAGASCPDGAQACPDRRVTAR
jgi:hypothetical protein